MFRKVAADFRSMHLYFWLTVAVFAAGAWLGGTADWAERLALSQIEGLSEVAQEFDRWTWSQTFLFIFFNNALKAVLVIFLGALLGLVPLAFVAVNGMVLGLLYREAGDEALMLMVRGILPHGWLELPVVLLAAAYGVRFGFLLVQSLFIRRGRWTKVERFLESTLPFMAFVVVALAAAALIETLITPIILGL